MGEVEEQCVRKGGQGRSWKFLANGDWAGARVDDIFSLSRSSDERKLEKHVRGQQSQDRHLAISSPIEGHGITKRAGIGAIFGVDDTGAVIFSTAVTGSSCEEAVERGELLK